MTNFANDLHHPGDQITANHSTALMVAARTERSKELARLFAMATRTFAGFFSNAAKAVEQSPANSNKMENHDLAA